MTRAVYLTSNAARALEEIYDYIARHDAPRRTDYVLAQIENRFDSLSECPVRGA